MVCRSTNYNPYPLLFLSSSILLKCEKNSSYNKIIRKLIEWAMMN